MMKTDELLTSRVRFYFTPVKFLSRHRVCLCSAAGNRFISDVFRDFKRFYNLGGKKGHVSIEPSMSFIRFLLCCVPVAPQLQSANVITYLAENSTAWPV